MPRLAAVTLMLLALLAAGCGGGGDDTAREVLRATFASDAKPAESGKVALALKVDAKGIEGLADGLDVQLAGPFQTRGEGQAPAFDLDLALTTKAGTLRTGAISTGDRAWLKLEGSAFTLGDDVAKQLVKPQQGKQGLDLGTLGVDPSRWLEDPETVGEEDVSGVRATHVRGTVDVPKLLEDLRTLGDKAGSLGAAGQAAAAGKLSDEQREKLEKSVESAKVDVWSGVDDRRLRRLLVDVKFDVPDEEQRGTVRFDLRLSELDTEQTITAPKDARPMSELQAGLAALAQAVQGGGEGAEAPSAAPSGGSYEQCLAAAGSDLRAQQECAAFLGG